MADYFFLENDNNQIVIDDNYHNPTFLFKQSVTTTDAMPYNKTQLVGGRYLPYRGYGTTMLIEQFQIEGSTKKFGSSSFVFGRSQSGQPIEVSIVGMTDSNGALIGYRPTVYSLTSGDIVDIAVFYLGKRTPSNIGLVLWNEQEEVVFDAMKGFLQIVDNLSLQINPAGGTHSYKVHDSAKIVDFDKLYICSLGLRPFYIRGGTIVINYRAFFPRLRKETNGDVYLDLVPFGDGASGAVIQNWNDTTNIMIAYVPY